MYLLINLYIIHIYIYIYLKYNINTYFLNGILDINKEKIMYIS